MKFAVNDHIEFKRTAGLGGWQPGTIISVEQRTYTIADSRGGRFANVKESHVRLGPEASGGRRPVALPVRVNLPGGESFIMPPARTVSGRDKAAVMAAPIVSRPKAPKKTRCRTYLDFVRSHPCCACGANADEAHHFGPRGMGEKCSDLLAVPLCKKHHDDFHACGVIAGLPESRFASDRVATEHAFYKTQAHLLCAWIESKGEE